MSETTTDKIRLSSIIREYGSAIRGDWGSIDGRGVRYDMDEFADCIDKGELLLDEKEAIRLRIRLDLCPEGGGHWSDYCIDYCDHGDDYDV